MRVFLLGAGYSARAYAHLAVEGGAGVTGTTRSADKAAMLEAEGIAPLVFDGSRIGPDMADALRRTTHLVLSAAPAGSRSASGPAADRGGGREDGHGADASLAAPPPGDDGAGETPSGDPLLALLPDPITEAMPRLGWIGYLSTVGVYGDHRGGVVTERSELRPVSRRAVERVKAEQAWREAGRRAGVPVAVLRLAGIYGPGRNALVNIERGTARRVVKPGQVFNRIHVADIAGALAHLAGRRLGGTFNVCDDEPGPPQDVIAFAARLMGVEPPPEIPFEQAQMSAMARSFWSDNKRVSNAGLKAAGYRFRFPDHRVALEAMWRDGSWRGNPFSRAGDGE